MFASRRHGEMRKFVFGKQVVGPGTLDHVTSRGESVRGDGLRHRLSPGTPGDVVGEPLDGLSDCFPSERRPLLSRREVVVGPVEVLVAS